MATLLTGKPVVDRLAQELAPRIEALGRAGIVPALAIDMQGFRLGYGGGYYDAFLADFPGVSIGLCREAQVVESLAALGARERYDIPVDLVITETRLLRARRGDEPFTA